MSHFEPFQSINMVTISPSVLKKKALVEYSYVCNLNFTSIILCLQVILLIQSKDSIYVLGEIYPHIPFKLCFLCLGYKTQSSSTPIPAVWTTTQNIKQHISSLVPNKISQLTCFRQIPLHTRIHLAMCIYHVHGTDYSQILQCNRRQSGVSVFLYHSSCLHTILHHTRCRLQLCGYHVHYV